MMYPSAGIKPEEVYVFTDFNFLESSQILKLLSLWIRVKEMSALVPLFQEISILLQGRPRFFTSFLQQLINSSDINGCFRSYAKALTTNFDSSLFDSSPYYFWKARIDW